MRVTARDIINKTAAPLPGASPFPARPAPKGPMAQPGQGPMPEKPRPDPEMMPEEPKGAPATETGETEDLQTMIRDLDSHFSDDKIADISEKMLVLMKIVPPEQGEKIAKVYTKFMEASMAMKANIAALQVMAMPAQQQQQLMNQNLQNLQNTAGPTDQGVKVGPIT